MQNERKRIIEMVEKGTISAQEAITLLEALEKDPPVTQTVNQQDDKKTQEEPVKNASQTDEAGSFEKNEQQSSQESDFSKMFQEEMKDFRKDLSQLGSIFMDVLNTTVKKVKDFDVKTPFGDKYKFTYAPVLSQQPLEEIDIDLPYGNVTIVPVEGGNLDVVLDVKTALVNNNEDETRVNVLDKIVVQNDNGKLSILSDTKLTQINVTISLPSNRVDVVKTRLLNGGVTLRDLTAQKLSVKTLNGVVKGINLTFDKAEIETTNGTIELREVTGKELDAETMNGRIYLDGALDDVEAKSVNGHVVVTTTTSNSSKIDAQTMAGAVEIYVPHTLSLNGRVSTNFGKLDVGIADASKVDQQEQFLAKTVRFEKEVPGANKLYIEAESKTGAVLVRYTVGDTTTQEQE